MKTLTFTLALLLSGCTAKFYPWGEGGGTDPEMAAVVASHKQAIEQIGRAVQALDAKKQDKPESKGK